MGSMLEYNRNDSCLPYNANDNGKITVFLFYEKDLFHFKLVPASKFIPSCHFQSLLSVSESWGEEPQRGDGGAPPPP